MWGSKQTDHWVFSPHLFCSYLNSFDRFQLAIGHILVPASDGHSLVPASDRTYLGYS